MKGLLALRRGNVMRIMLGFVTSNLL